MFFKKLFTNTKALIFFVFIFSFIVYVITLSRTLTYVDNGELTAVCVTLGIAHPTGYPLFTLLGHLWSLLPLPFSKVILMNLFVATLTAISASILFLTIQLLLGNIEFSKKQILSNKKNKEIHIIKSKFDLQNYQINAIAFVIALTYAFADTVWQQATSLEVYSLELLLVNLIFYFTIKAYFTKSQFKSFLILAFVFGLALTNHLTTVLLLPAILYLFFLNSNDKLSFNTEQSKKLLILILFAIVPLSLYLYLPIRSAMLPPVNWGWVHRSFSKFLYHLSGKQYQVWMFSSPQVIIKNLKVYMSLLPYEYAFIGIIFIVIGLIKAWRARGIFWVLVLMILGNVFYSLNYSIYDIDSYFLPSFIAFFIFMAIGTALLVKSKPISFNFIALFFILNLAINFSANDQSNDKLVEEYTKNVLSSIDKNGIVISAQWDYFVSPFLFEQIVENKRPDIIILEKELLRRTWYPLQFNLQHPEIYKESKDAFTDYEEILERFESGLPYNPDEIQMKYYGLINDIIQKNIDKRPIYITHDVLRTELDFFKNFNIIPKGFALQIFTKDTVLSPNLACLDLKYLETNKDIYKGYLPTQMMDLISQNLANIGIYSFQHSQIQTANEAINLSLYFNPKNSTALGVKSMLQ
jgi:hypothetical protein